MIWRVVLVICCVALVAANLPCVFASPSEAADTVFSVNHGGRLRHYRVYTPSAAASGTRLPMILNLHGGGTSAKEAAYYSRMNEAAERFGFLAVYPQGVGPERNGRIVGTWNAARCCGQAADAGVDDVGFVEAVIDDVQRHYSVDTRRIFATGLSNGALLSYRLACALSDRVAAIAPIGAQDSLRRCKPARAVPIIHFHGTDDQAAPYAGGQCGGKLNTKGWQCKSVPRYLEEWRLRNGCRSSRRQTYSKRGARCFEFKGCRNHATVALCTIKDGGHTWPGGRLPQGPWWYRKALGRVSRDIDANTVMWRFFREHPMPQR